MRNSKSLDASKQMKKDIHFLLKRIEWYNSWLRAMELLSTLFPSARPGLKAQGMSALWNEPAKASVASPLSVPSPDLAGESGWRLAGLMGWMAPGPAQHRHGCILPSPLSKPMLSTTQLQLEHWAVPAQRPIMRWRIPPKGSLFHFVLLKDYFLYLVAFECGLWLNHRNGYFPKCLPFFE